MSPVQVAGWLPPGLRGSRGDGSLSMMEKSSDAADEALVMASICGRMNKTEVAPSVTWSMPIVLVTCRHHTSAKGYSRSEEQ